MALIPKPPFPNVPNLPGVPQLPRLGKFASSPPLIVGLVAAGAQIFRAFFTRPVWGIFKEVAQTPDVTEDENGVQTVEVTGPKKLVPVVVPDNILEMSYRNEWNVPDYPVEDGGFANYNKVNNPYEITLRMTKGGSVSDRQDFLNQLDEIADSLDLYQIITPEKTYHDANIIRVEYARRGVKGAYFLEEVDVVVKEIRTVTAQYTTTAAGTQNAQDASAVPPVNRGSTQGIPPTVNVGAP